MKTLFAVVLMMPLVFWFGIAAAREKTGMVIVNEIDPGHYLRLQKMYDYDNGVVCYLYSGGPSGTAISCLPNQKP